MSNISDKILKYYIKNDNTQMINTTSIPYNYLSLFYEKNKDIIHIIFSNPFSNEINTRLIQCILSIVMYDYRNDDLNNVLQSLSIKKYNICNIDDKLVFGVFNINNRLIISIKGTTTLNDIFADIDIVPVKNCKVPGKISRGYNNVLFDSISSLYSKDENKPVFTIKENPSKKLSRIDVLINSIYEYLYCLDISAKPYIYLCGHSEGGALATIIFSFILEKMKKNPIFNNPIKDNLYLYTFGCPRVGNKEFINSIENTDKSFRIVNGGDIITHLPLNTSMFNIKYKHYSKKYHYKNDNICSIGNIIKNKIWSISDHSLEKYFYNIYTSSANR